MLQRRDCRKGAAKVLLGQMPVFTSDNVVLCKPSGVKSLDFFDTLHPPPKTPGKRPLQAGQLAVYPRVCGGTDHEINLIRGHNGLSPRVRGNRSPNDRRRRSDRSIPARAGERRSALPDQFRNGVYPRVYG